MEGDTGRCKGGDHWETWLSCHLLYRSLWLPKATCSFWGLVCVTWLPPTQPYFCQVPPFTLSRWGQKLWHTKHSHKFKTNKKWPNGSLGSNWDRTKVIHTCIYERRRAQASALIHWFTPETHTKARPGPGQSVSWALNPDLPLRWQAPAGQQVLRQVSSLRAQLPVPRSAVWQSESGWNHMDWVG